MGGASGPGGVGFTSVVFESRPFFWLFVEFWAEWRDLANLVRRTGWWFCDAHPCMSCNSKPPKTVGSRSLLFKLLPTAHSAEIRHSESPS